MGNATKVAAGLRISDEFSFPLDVAVESLAILGTKGSGKSHTGAVLCEELWDANVQFVVLDPTGVFWGLRSSADGKSDGIPVIILGGPHGDAPLEPTAGALIADVLVDTGQSLVLDLSDFPSKAAQTRFATDFAERLYRRKARARTPLHIVIDEAEEFIPQDVRADGARMVGAWETIVALGRSRGLGESLISRRVQAINKKVLDLIETMLALRIGAPLARKRIEEWIEAKEVEDEGGIVRTLKELPTGTGWVWSPIRGALVEVNIRRLRTFDSYATPKPNEKRLEPRALAPIDVEALGAQIAATVEQAKKSDPKELLRMNAELRKRLDDAEETIGRLQRAAGSAEARVELVVEKIEVPLFTDAEVERLADLVEALREVSGQISASGESVAAKVEQAARDLVERVRGVDEKITTARQTPPPAAAPSPAPARRPVAPTDPSDGEVALKAGARRMLEMLARLHPEGLTRVQLGTLADITPTSGTFSDYLSALRRAGLVDVGYLITLTALGLERAADHVGHGAPSPADLKEMWSRKLKAGARRMLDELFACYPEGLTRDELAERAEITRSSGTFSDYLSSLRRNKVAVEHGGRVYAGDALFIGGR